MNAFKQRPQSIVAILTLIFLAAVDVRAQTVEVTSADPASAPQGTVSLDVAISGSGFDSTANVKFLVTGTNDPGGITVKKVAVRGSKKLIATIDIADTAVIDKFDIEVTLSSGRKGKGTTLFTVQPKSNNDPCVAAVGFPAFSFHRISGQIGLYVADLTGKCVRFLSSEARGDYTRFSYPLRDDYAVATNRGRVVWWNSNQTVQNQFVAMDFEVVNNDVIPGPTYVVADFGPDTSTGGGSTCCGLDLSPDGRDLYVPALPELRPEGYVHSVVRIRLPVDLADVDSSNLPTPVTVFEHQPGPTDVYQWSGDLDVDARGEFLYVGQWTDPANGGTIRLLRVDLDPDMTDTGTNPEVTVLRDPSTRFVAADVSNPSSDLIAIGNDTSSGQCRLLVIMNGRTGTVLNEGTQWRAWEVSWMNGEVLTNGLNKGCKSQGTIVAVDPVTGATRNLVTGYYPDGR